MFDDVAPRLFALALRAVPDPAASEDLVQETLTRALSKSHQLNDPSRLDSWPLGRTTADPH